MVLSVTTFVCYFFTFIGNDLLSESLSFCVLLLFLGVAMAAANQPAIQFKIYYCLIEDVHSTFSFYIFSFICLLLVRTRCLQVLLYMYVLLSCGKFAECKRSMRNSCFMLCPT